MFIAKSRVLLDKDGNCVAADDPSGVQILAGFKGAQVPEKTISRVKGWKKHFTNSRGEDHPEDEREAAPQKRVAPEPESAHHKAAVIKK